MTWNVVINYEGEQIRLDCASYEEACMVRTSFVNWGGVGYDIDIEQLHQGESK